MGSLSNGDGNDDGYDKKAKGFQISKTKIYHAFFVHFLAVVARLRHEKSNFTRPLYGVDEHNTKFSFYFSKLRYVPFVRIQPPKISPAFDKLNKVEQDRWILKEFEFTFGLLSSRKFTTMAT